MNGRLDARERQGERLCYQPTLEAAKAEFEASWRQWRGQKLRNFNSKPASGS
jgi:hypothetical protein